jgi:hypothetical protein
MFVVLNIIIDNLCKSVHGEDQNYYRITDENWFYYLSLEFSQQKKQKKER